MQWRKVSEKFKGKGKIKLDNTTKKSIILNKNSAASRISVVQTGDTGIYAKSFESCKLFGVLASVPSSNHQE